MNPQYVRLKAHHRRGCGKTIRIVLQPQVFCFGELFVKCLVRVVACFFRRWERGSPGEMRAIAATFLGERLSYFRIQSDSTAPFFVLWQSVLHVLRKKTVRHLSLSQPHAERARILPIHGSDWIIRPESHQNTFLLCLFPGAIDLVAKGKGFIIFDPCLMNAE